MSAIPTKVPMTVAGEQHLRDELDYMKNTKRREISQKIAEARELGDLKENAEYHAAREEQGLLEARIRDVEAKLANCQVIDVTKLSNNGKVVFGATIQLINIDTDESMTYQIVGEDEADLKANKISVTSPIARGLVGKMEGDEVDIKTPAGDVTYEISKVDYI